MNKENYCNLIEDLLPLYVEGLVSEDSKQEIENHLKKCNKCSEALRNIKKDDNLFSAEEHIHKEIQENSQQEIKCIKNIKRKMNFTIIIAIAITIVITLFGIHIWNTYRIMEDENGKLFIYNMVTGNIKKGIDATNIYAKYTIPDNLGKDINYNVVITFDKKDICINTRIIISGYSEEEANNFKKSWEEHPISSSNIKIENQNIYMNDNSYVGKTKQEIIEILKELSNNIKIIEI